MITGRQYTHTNQAWDYSQCFPGHKCELVVCGGSMYLHCPELMVVCNLEAVAARCKYQDIPSKVGETLHALDLIAEKTATSKGTSWETASHPGTIDHDTILRGKEERRARA